MISSNYLREESTPAIKKQVKLLLNAAGIGDKLPTPITDIVQCSKLVEIDDLDLSFYEETFLKHGLGVLKQAIKKIRGFLDYHRNVYYVDPFLHKIQKKFITYHEVTHRILPWHKEILNPHHDTDITLKPQFTSRLEVEANLGSALIQFQVDRFKDDLSCLPMGLASAVDLSQRYESSLHSTFRKYIEDNNGSCALLVIPEKKILSVTESLKLWYPLQSKKFTNQFGYINWPDNYQKGHPVFDLIHQDTLELIKKHEITLKDSNGFDKKCKMEAFCNRYTNFVLIFPVPLFSFHTTNLVQKS